MARREFVAINEDKRAIGQVVHELVMFRLHPALVIETMSVSPVHWVTVFTCRGYECSSRFTCQL